MLLFVNSSDDSYRDLWRMYYEGKMIDKKENTLILGNNNTGDSFLSPKNKF